jgi:undecaprenyl-diphosphatase
LDLLSTIKEIDTELFLFLNSIHTPFFDVVMVWISGKLSWLPLYVLFLYLIIKQYGKGTWLILLFTGVLITLSDQISLNVFKNNFMRFRPSHNLDIKDVIHIINNYRGGTYGFISSHSANMFALATYLFFIFKNNIKNIGYYLFPWAAIIAYSRIYLGVHYPTDITIGAIVGIVIGITVYKLYRFTNSKISKG